MYKCTSTILVYSTCADIANNIRIVYTRTILLFFFVLFFAISSLALFFFGAPPTR